MCLRALYELFLGPDFKKTCWDMDFRLMDFISEEFREGYWEIFTVIVSSSQRSFLVRIGSY